MAEKLKFYFESASTYLAEGDKPLGFGRYGEVWAAYSEEGNVKRAVKISSEKYRSVLQTEFDNLKTLEKVDEDGLIVRVYEIGHTNDARPCMLMELIEARPLRSLADELRQRLGSKKWTQEDEKLRIKVAAQIANALYTAFKAGITLTDLKIDNFFYHEDWEQLVKVIDWNLVDDKSPHNSFVDDTLPKLGDVFYEIFTGLSLREQKQEGQLGNINKDLFAKTRSGQTWPMYWDQITFGTRKILHDMIFSGFTGDNQPFDLWSRWTTRRRVLVDRAFLDEYLGTEAADIAGNLDTEKTPEEMIEIYSVLQINAPNENREKRLREWTHRKIARLVAERDFIQSYLYLLSAHRMYAGSLRLDYWTLFTSLGITSKSSSLYIEQIQDLPDKMERHWKANEFEQLNNMLVRIEGKVKNYWASTNEITGIIEKITIITDFLRQLMDLENLLTGEDLEGFYISGDRIFKQISSDPWLKSYLKDAGNIPPSFDILFSQLERIHRLYTELKQTQAKEVESELYQFILSSLWHNITIIPLYESKLEYLNNYRRHSVAEVGFRIDKFRQDVRRLEQEIDTATTEMSPVVSSLPVLEEKKEEIKRSIEYLRLQIQAQGNDLAILTESLDKLEDLKDRLVKNASQGYSQFNEISSLQKKLDKFAVEIENNLSMLVKKSQQLGLNADDINRNISILDKKKENIIDQAEALEKKIEKVYERVRGMDESTIEVENRANALKVRQQSILSQIKQIESGLIQFDETYSIIEARFGDSYKQVDQLAALEQKVSKQIEGIDNRLNDLDQKKSALRTVEDNLQGLQRIQEDIDFKIDHIHQGFALIGQEHKELLAQSDKLGVTLLEAENGVQGLDERLRKVRLKQARQWSRLKWLTKMHSSLTERISNIGGRFVPFIKKNKENEKTTDRNSIWIRRASWSVLIVVLAFGTYVFLIPFYQAMTFQPVNDAKATATSTSTKLQIENNTVPSVIPNSGLTLTAAFEVSTITSVPFTSTATMTNTPSATPTTAVPTTAALPVIDVIIKDASVYLKTADTENAFNAQWPDGALEFGPGDTLPVIGRNQNSEWLLLGMKDDQEKYWFGWTPRTSLNSIDEAVINSLPTVITCTARGVFPLYDLQSGENQVSKYILQGGENQVFNVKRNVVYLGKLRDVDEKGLVWVQLENGLSTGWIQGDYITCSTDIINLPELKK